MRLKPYPVVGYGHELTAVFVSSYVCEVLILESPVVDFVTFSLTQQKVEVVKVSMQH